MYVLVRKDLTPPQQAVQACHAAIEATRQFLPAHAEHPHLVLLGVKSQHQLENTAMQLRSRDIPFQEFREPDIDNELTAIATAPLTGDVRKFFKRFNCLNLQGSRLAHSTLTGASS